MKRIFEIFRLVNTEYNENKDLFDQQICKIMEIIFKKSLCKKEEKASVKL